MKSGKIRMATPGQEGKPRAGARNDSNRTRNKLTSEPVGETDASHGAACVTTPAHTGNDATDTALSVTVEGRVTGVGFRYAAVREAGRHAGLQGSVRNADARTVVCVVQGRPDAVSAMLAWLRQGPPPARVLKCRIAEIPVNPERRPFHVEY